MKKYLNSKELYDEVVKAQQTHLPSERLGELMLLLHDKILLHRNFRHYSKELKEDMRGKSLERIFKRGLYSFDATRGEKAAFSYFTRAIFVNYIAFLKKHYNELNKKRQYIKDFISQNYFELEQNNPRLREFIDNFEVEGEFDEK